MAEPAPPLRRRDPTQAIRYGLRQSPLTDLYYHLMRAPWWQLVALLSLCYVLANVGFAILYMTDMQGIASAHEGSFPEAFAFSVQTISTIGYGALAPTSPWVHTIVTAEAFVGILGFALATGLMFAKFAIPRARVLFSTPLVITTRHGKPTLMFRVGNARGNEIIEASMRVTVLKSERTPEGHTMRRLHDLQLERATSPLFTMTWTVLHVIDEGSPLYGEDAASLQRDDVFFIVSLTGIDSTFSQTIHGRHLYEWHDVRYRQRFADIITFVEDGRARIDYTRFHETEPDT